MTAKGFYIIVLLAVLAVFWILPRTRLGTVSVQVPAWRQV
jgi:hypothetical protein